MIHYLPNKEINKQKWDACIAASPHGLVYASSWYLDIVSPGWDALIEDDYSSVFPLTHRKKAGISYLFQPFFTQQLGLFSGSKSTAPEKVSDFLLAIPPKFRLIEIQLNAGNAETEVPGFQFQRRLTHHLGLDDTHEMITGNYSENTARNIKKSARASLTVSTDIVIDDIISLFRQNRGADIGNLKQRDYDMFRQLLREAGSQNLIDCRGILKDSGDLIAGAIFLESFHSYIFLFSATSREAKEAGAMAAIIDSFISSHCNEKKVLDFEGSMDVNLARFYKGFGSKEIVYLQIRKNNLPFFIRWLK